MSNGYQICGCRQPLWAPRSQQRGQCEGCRISTGERESDYWHYPVIATGDPCALCGLLINPIFGTVHHDCAREIANGQGGAA